MTFFDSSNHGEMGSREPVPAGEYTCEIADTDWRQNKSGTGHHLMIQFKIVEGEYKGRSIFTNINLDNPSATVIEIAQKEFATLVRALFGKDKKLDSHEQIRGMAVRVKARIDKGNEQYGPQNRVDGYETFSAGPGGKKKSKKGKKKKGDERPW